MRGKWRLPLSLSSPSAHWSSRGMLQSIPSHPLSQRQLHWPSDVDLQEPCLEHSCGQPSKVQCLPFQPVTHKQEPFLHWPCSLQLSNCKVDALVALLAQVQPALVASVSCLWGQEELISNEHMRSIASPSRILIFSWFSSQYRFRLE